jgi:SAM-dependent methyltransferase
MCKLTAINIGLGRYGDTVDPYGDIKAVANLKDIVKPGGIFIFVVPMGVERIQFNAHRIYSYESIISMFDKFEMLEFSLIPDNYLQYGIIPSPPPHFVNSQSHGCGCFVFQKASE